MTVLSHKLHSAGASGEASGSSPDQVSYNYAAKYWVKCDSPLDGPKTILQYFKSTAGLPWFGDSFSFGNDTDTNAKCRSIAPSYVVNSEGWNEVDVKWEQSGGGSAETTPPTNLDANGKETDDPEDWNDEVDSSFTQISVPVEKAIFRGFTPEGGHPFLRPGKVGPTVNSAMVPFDPPPEMEMDIEVVRFTKWQPDWDGAEGKKWIGRVNSDAVVINKPECNFKDNWPALWARIKAYSGVFVMTKKGPWWKRTIEVHINWQGWRGVLVDRGLTGAAIDGRRPDGTVVSSSADWDEWLFPLVDADGYQISEPVLLDGKGKPLVPGKPPVYLTYTYYEEKSFAGIKW